MSAYVIDTNVIAVANNQYPKATLQCIQTCVQALSVARNGLVVIDNGNQVLTEYKNYINFGGQFPGDMFFKWLHINLYNPQFCEQVSLPLRKIKINGFVDSPDADDFEHFPDDPTLEGFDRKDRKFVVLALMSAHQPEVLNVTDSDWWYFKEPLKKHGLHITFLCPDAMPTDS